MRSSGTVTTKSQHTKALIDDTVQALLKEKSYNELKLKDVYTRAGITPSIFYYYYENLKSAILFSFPKMDAHFGPEFEAQIAGKCWREKLHIYARTYGAASEQSGHFYSAQIFKAQMDNGGVVTSLRRPLYQCLISILTEGISHLRPECSPCALADCIIAGMRGISCDWAMSESDASLPDALERFMDLILDGATVPAPLAH